jgi:TolA-binding protein
VRPRVLALALTVVLAAGCSDDASPTTGWADGVCSAWSELSADIRGLTDGLSLDSLSQESLQNLQTELEDRLSAIQASAQNLADAITDTPEGAGQAVEDAQQELSTDADEVRAGLDTIGQAFQGLSAATSGEDVTAVLSDAQAGLTATGQALTSLDDTVRGYASAADDTLQQAFDDAQSCQQTRTGGTTS